MSETRVQGRIFPHKVLLAPLYPGICKVLGAWTGDRKMYLITSVSILHTEGLLLLKSLFSASADYGKLFRHAMNSVFNHVYPVTLFLN